jgi:hypothetical protein
MLTSTALNTRRQQRGITLIEVSIGPDYRRDYCRGCFYCVSKQ